MLIRDEKGLTLVEVLVAFVILTMALVTMMSSFALGGRQNADTYRYNTALTLAQSKMEEIKNSTFKNVDNVLSTGFSMETDYSQYTGFSYTVAVVKSGLNKTVTVTVSYIDEGVPKQLALTSEITKR